jgi:hypothetical protein
MKDAIVPLGKDDHFVARLLHELAPPALPADGLPLSSAKNESQVLVVQVFLGLLAV